MKKHIPTYRKYTNKKKGTTLGFVEVKGQKRYFPGPYNSKESYAAYQAFLAGVLEERGQGKPTGKPATGSITIAELVERYLIYAAEYYGRANEYGCLFDACRPLVMLHGTTPVREFGPSALVRVRDGMVAGYLKQGDEVWTPPKKKWCRPYINHQIVRLKRIFVWGVGQEIVPASVSDAIQAITHIRKHRTTARETRRVLPVTQSTIDATIAQMPPVLSDMVSLGSLTGMRPENLCAIRPMDVDTSGPVWQYRPVTHKNLWREDELVVFLGPRSQAILEKYMQRPADSFCFSPAEAWEQRLAERRAKRKTPVQPSQQNRRKERRMRPHGVRYSVQTYRKAIQYAVRLANQAIDKENAELPQAERKFRIQSWHPHQLRHTAGTDIRKVYGVEGAQVYLGHGRADVTQVYAERDLELAERIALERG